MLKHFVLVGLTVASLGASSLEFIQAANGSAHAMPIKVALKTSQGEFRNAEKSTKGNATIKTIDGKQFLHLGSNFTTSNGPQVEVLLHRDAVPQSYNSSNYVSLGEIKSFQGEQWYEIPAGVDPSGYQSVSIWCREFDVTFGFATLLQS